MSDPGDGWLVERGIGEDRAVRMVAGAIVAARLDWPGGLRSGQIEDAVLVARATGATRGTARFAGGEEALVSQLPGDAREGAAIRLQVTRAALRESRRIKLAQARPTTASPRPAPTLADLPGARIVRRIDGWDEVWSEAWHGAASFAGGSLDLFPTAAMTLIDVDGDLAPRQLAQAAVPALAAAIHRMDLSGSIGIDFPTLQAREDRRALDAALADALPGWPHERTAINGFGFVQIVSRRERPSLLDLLHGDRAGAAARLLLRRAEAVTAPGVLELRAPRAVHAAMLPQWEAELARRSGRTVRWQVDDALALDGSFAQAVVA